VETVGSKRSYALTWCMPNDDDDDDDMFSALEVFYENAVYKFTFDIDIMSVCVVF